MQARGKCYYSCYYSCNLLCTFNMYNIACKRVASVIIYIIICCDFKQNKKKIPQKKKNLGKNPRKKEKTKTFLKRDN